MQVIGNSQNCNFSYFIYSLLPSRLWLSYGRNQWNWRLVFFLQFFHPKWLIKIDLRKAKNFLFNHSIQLSSAIVLHSLPWIWSIKQVRCFAHWLNGCWLIQGSGCTFSGNNNVLEKQRCQNHISTRYLQDRNRIYLLDTVPTWSIRTPERTLWEKVIFSALP